MPVRLFDAFSKFDGIDRWPLMSVQFWGEPSAGEWKIIIDNKEGFNQLSSWKKQQEAFEKSAGQWDSVHMVAYGTESFPIRLKPPSKERQPPKVCTLLGTLFVPQYLGKRELKLQSVCRRKNPDPSF